MSRKKEECQLSSLPLLFTRQMPAQGIVFHRVPLKVFCSPFEQNRMRLQEALRSFPRSQDVRDHSQMWKT